MAGNHDITQETLIAGSEFEPFCQRLPWLLYLFSASAALMSFYRVLRSGIFYYQKTLKTFGLMNVSKNLVETDKFEFLIYWY